MKVSSSVFLRLLVASTYALYYGTTVVGFQFPSIGSITATTRFQPPSSMRQPIPAGRRGLTVTTPPPMKATINTESSSEWTPKRLHNANWFRSAALLLTLSLVMGITQPPTSMIASSSLSSSSSPSASQFGAMMHLFAFSTWFGTMIYTTFIFGITAFKNLPRQTFGKLQAKLFPKYFSLGSICLVIQILTLRHLSIDFWTNKAVKYSLGSALLATLYNQFSLEPYTTKLMLERYELENKDGTDTDRYRELRKQFGKLHGLSSLTNLLALCGTIAYGWILSGKLIG